MVVKKDEIVPIDINFALITDRMYKGKLKDGDLDKFTAEQISEMESICQARRDYVQSLEDVLYATGI